jgi:quercetin dioxygenase-like cupin family protein
MIATFMEQAAFHGRGQWNLSPTVVYLERNGTGMVKITTQDENRSVPQDRPEMFIGEVRGQNLVADGDAPSQRVTAITFADGARNRWHWHSTEQVLVVTHGEGIIADADGEHPIAVGDVVLIQAEERHWHGARPGASMTHLSILLPGSMTIDENQES